jgi:hypothetical protein
MHGTYGSPSVTVDPDFDADGATVTGGFVVNWGDGIQQDYSASATSFSHTYADGEFSVGMNGPYYDSPGIFGAGFYVTASILTSVNVTSSWIDVAPTEYTANVPSIPTLGPQTNVALGQTVNEENTWGLVGESSSNASSPVPVTGNPPPPFPSTFNWGDGSAPDVRESSMLDDETRSHLYVAEGLYGVTLAGGVFTDESRINVYGPPLTLSAISDPTVAPGKSVDVTASYTGLVGPGYAFVDWGDGKGPQPVQLVTTGSGNFATSGTITAHYDSVPANGLSGTLYLYDMHGLMAMQTFGVICGYTATLTMGTAADPSLFTPIFLDIPNSFDDTDGTFTLTYSASNPANDTITGSGTNSDPYGYTPAPGAYTIWIADGSGNLNQADLNNNGSFVNSGVSYPLSALPTIDEADGHASGLYIEAVNGSIGAAVGAVSISVTSVEGDAFTATLSNPPPPDESIMPLSTSGTSVSSNTSSDSAGNSSPSSANLPNSAATIQARALGDAKQEIGVKYFGLASGDYPGQQNEYNHNWIYKKMADRLVPGKVQYYTNLVMDARAADDAIKSASFAAQAQALSPLKASQTSLQSVWTLFTWCENNPLSSGGLLGSIVTNMATGDFAEVAKSYNALLSAAGDNYQTGQNETALLLKCYRQGLANAANGLQDVVIDLANLSIKLSSAYWVAAGLGHDLALYSPDWSYGVISTTIGGASYYSFKLAGG